MPPCPHVPVAEAVNQQYRKQINRSVLPGSDSLPAVGLFAGILGLDIGLARAGFCIRAALDFDSDAQNVVAANVNNVGDFPYLCENITNFPPHQLLEAAGRNEGDLALLAGGPPCQPYSKSGLRRGAEDSRGLLFQRYLTYLEAMKPQAFVLENVRGLFSSRGGKDFQTVLNEFRRTGYTVYWRIMDAAAYGVPQFRQRLFIVGFRNRLRFEWPVVTHGDPDVLSSDLFNERQPFVTVGDAIADLEHDTSAPAYSGRFAALLKDIPEGLNYSHYCAERAHPSPLFEWRSKFWYFLLKIDRRRPSLTIQAHPGNNTGPFHWANRRLSIAELLRLQSFPDWTTVHAHYFTAHRLIGNAVPPLLAEAVGRSIRTALEDNEIISHREYERSREAEHRRSGFVQSGRGSGKGKRPLSPL
jgi:DNA (cytosine-5)-methyltransferase 1